MEMARGERMIRLSGRRREREKRKMDEYKDEGENNQEKTEGGQVK